MIIIFAHKLADDIKIRLLAEIEKVRLDACIDIIQKTSNDITAETLSEIGKTHPELCITEDMILQNIPRMSDNLHEPTTDKSGISLDEKNARKYHTKNMVKSFNIAKQRHVRQKHHSVRNKIR